MEIYPTALAASERSREGKAAARVASPLPLRSQVAIGIVLGLALGACGIAAARRSARGGSVMDIFGPAELGIASRPPGWPAERPTVALYRPASVHAGEVALAPGPDRSLPPGAVRVSLPVTVTAAEWASPGRRRASVGSTFSFSLASLRPRCAGDALYIVAGGRVVEVARPAKRTGSWALARPIERAHAWYVERALRGDPMTVLVD